MRGFALSGFRNAALDSSLCLLTWAMKLSTSSIVAVPLLRSGRVRRTSVTGLSVERLKPPPVVGIATTCTGLPSGPSMVSTCTACFASSASFAIVSVSFGMGYPFTARGGASMSLVARGGASPGRERGPLPSSS